MNPISRLLFMVLFYAISLSMASSSFAASEFVYTKAVFSLPLTYDPTEMDDEASLTISNLIYDGLLSFTPSLRIQGALAETWKTSRDGKTLTFNLRKNAKFQDGNSVTAMDVVNSLERAVRPGSTVFNLYDCIVGATEFFNKKAKRVTGLRAIDKSTVEISLVHPFPPFLMVLAGATAKILPASAMSNSDFFKNPVGTGAFKFSGVKADAKIPTLTLVRNDNYFLTPPKITKFVFLQLNEPEALKLAQAGNISDLAGFPLNGTEPIFNVGSRMDVSTAATWIIGLSSNIKPFDNVIVRRAFRASIDVEAFRKKFHPNSIPSNGYIPPGIPGFNSGHEVVSLAPAVNAIPKTKITIWIPAELDRADEMKVFFEEQLRAKGWNASVVALNWAEMMKGYKGKTLQAFLVSMNMDYPDAEFLLRNFHSKNPDNFSGLKDKTIDKLLATAHETQDRNERQSIYRDLIKRIDGFSVTVNLFHPRTSYWTDLCVSGFEPNYLSPAYIDYRSVTIDSACEQKRSHAL